MRCPWCGVENKPGAKTCSECGVILLFDSGINDANSPPPPPKPVIEKAPRTRVEKPYDPYREKWRTALIVGSVIASIFVIMLVMTFVISVPSPLTGGDARTAQPLEGTWTTYGNAALFTIRTNWPTGNMTYIGYENRTLSIVITGTEDPALVYADVSYNVQDSNIQQDAMYGSEPTQFRCEGKVNGTTLTLEQNGFQAVFDQDGRTLTGYWDDRLTFSYFTEEVQSGAYGITLFKQ